MSAPTLGQSISLLIPISQPMPTKQRMPISQPMPINQPTAQQLSNPAGSFPHQLMPINYPTAQQLSNPVGSFSHQPMPINQPTVQQPSIPVSSFSRYLSPAPDTFVLNLLGLCPPQTSSCFGCRNTLKPGGHIANPPSDLVILSNMKRQWRQEGQILCKSGNVHFHCIPTCVQLRQPYFQPLQCFIPRQIVPFLQEEHWVYIRGKLGNLAIR